jgi:hypothetical protein
MKRKQPDIDLRPILDQFRNFDTSETEDFALFLDRSADQIRDAADAVSNARLLNKVHDKVVVDRMDIVRSQIREFKLLIYKLDHSSQQFDRLLDVLGALEEELKRNDE